MLPSFRFLLAVAVAFTLATPVSAGVWKDVNENAMLSALTPARRSVAKRDIVPLSYRTLSLDRPALAALLSAALPERAGRIEEAGIEIELPLPYGGMGRFLVLDSPIMEEGLSKKYPQLKSYVLQGIDDPTATGRADLTPKGFRAIILSSRGQFFIDPYWSDEDRDRKSVV